MVEEFLKKWVFRTLKKKYLTQHIFLPTGPKWPEFYKIILDWSFFVFDNLLVFKFYIRLIKRSNFPRSEPYAYGMHTSLIRQ